MTTVGENDRLTEIAESRESHAVTPHLFAEAAAGQVVMWRDRRVRARRPDNNRIVGTVL